MKSFIKECILFLRRIINFFPVNDFNRYSFIFSGFYYSQSSGCLIILLKREGKGRVFHVPLDELVSSKTTLDNIHPISCFYIGYLFKKFRSCKKEGSNLSDIEHLIDIKNNFENIKMENMISYNGINLTEEILYFKIKNSGDTLNIKIDKLVRNKKILNVINPRDAFLIGHNTFDLLKESYNNGALPC